MFQCADIVHGNPFMRGKKLWKAASLFSQTTIIPVQYTGCQAGKERKSIPISRFVEVDATLINVDHIVYVQMNKDCSLRIILDNGDFIETDEAPERTLNAIAGRDFIVAASSCEGVYVSIDHEGSECRYPVHQLGVTADGAVRPLILMFDTVEFYDKWPGFRGMVHPPADTQNG